MKWYWGVYLLIIIDCTLKWAESICVLDSDFGFNLNCGFKKSGLFRVRNLGGVKGYVGLGFSVGDELGFGDSLSNTDTNKRRSVATARSANITGTNSTTKKRADNLRRSVNPAALPVPPFKPIPPASHLQSSASPRNFSVFPTRITISNIRQVPAPTLIAAIPVLPPSFQSLPSSITKATATVTTQPPPKSQLVGVQVIPAPIAFKTSLDAATKHFQVRKDTEPASSDNGVASNTLSLRQLGSAPSGQDFTSQNELDIKASLPNAMSSSIKLLAQATNLSEDAIAAAIAIRQKQLLQQQQQAELALATSTTKKPLDTNVINKYPLSSISKVMNAPREYYPVGYDKNFDDNFASRVELPDTSFYCGDQKHFPGLYADEDLGCMVFHVCAFTDDGLIMKSFLCPESTLFDQSILKCNWWFYVDCKSSKKLYDSNIPISKSYQLMKALAFFSSYNKQ